MTKKQKEEVFKTVLELTHKGEDDERYYEQSEGAFKVLQTLGLDTEYVWWAIGK